MLPTRNGKSFSKAISDRESWATPSPKEEARHCFEIAKRNGGIPAMRLTIGISLEEHAELVEWMQREPRLARRVAAAIAYRERVLAEFDSLSKILQVQACGEVADLRSQ